jgi:glycosyltransferase involved in cell wall biosynthesis
MKVDIPKFSICVPVSISNNEQFLYLKELFDSIATQSFSDFNLIVSDDSDSRDVAKLCAKWNSTSFPVEYFSAPNPGISRNLNNSVEKATGEYVKIMFQDDFFFSSTALEEIYREIKDSGHSWYLSGCNHFSQERLEFYSHFFPKTNPRLLQGHNSISSPSVVTLERKAFEKFSSKLTYLLDCEWYLRMSHKHGMPIFGRSIHVTNRVHELQATNWAKNYLVDEISLSNMMHSEKLMGRKVCSCL